MALFKFISFGNASLILRSLCFASTYSICFVQSEFLVLEFTWDANAGTEIAKEIDRTKTRLISFLNVCLMSFNSPLFQILCFYSSMI